MDLGKTISYLITVWSKRTKSLIIGFLVDGAVATQSVLMGVVILCVLSF